MEPGGDSDTPSFWFQPPTNNRRRPQLVNPVVLILAIPILTLLVLFFLVPPFLSHTNQILRPNSVKKSWDSLNILLVLFAILCGVFARRNDEAPPSDDTDNRRLGSVSSLGNKPRQSAAAWLDFPDRKEYNDNVIHGDVGSSGGGLRRSSSSYPDLRQESIWENGNRFKFVDDFEVNFYRSPPPPDNFESRPRRRSHEGLRGEAETLLKEIPVDKFEARPAPVDKFEVRSTPAPPKSTAPPPPPPPSASAANLKRRRSVHSVSREENGERHRNHESEVASENQRPVPPPPAVEPEFQLPEVISEKVRRKKSVATKEIATAIASLYKGQRKRKKRGKSRNIYESAAPQSSSPPQSAAPPPAPPPPPPPPPPPSKVLQNFFKKSTKSKRVHSVPTAAPLPPPPPPLPPPNSIFNNLFKTTGTKSKRFLQSSTTPPLPPLPPSSILNSLFNNGSKSRRLKNTITSPPPPPPPPPGPSRSRQLNNGRPPKPTKPTPQDHENAFVAPPSPLIPLPPPPPPFRMSRARFVARGDFVRIRSAHSSRCSSPELEDVDDMVSVKDGGPSVSCPSPDVNVKADTFIARLRDEWRLEKVNSIKEKRTSG